MGGDSYDSGAGSIALALAIIVGVPLILGGIVGILALLMAVTVGWL